MDAFPIAGPCTFTTEFNPPKHNGVDLFATAGTPIVAPEAGNVKFGADPMGGNVFNLTTATGRRYYGAHMTQAEGVSRAVQAGDVIGYVGMTGNAQGTSPHCHFEVHEPPSGAAVDPYPLLAAVAGPEALHPVAAYGPHAPQPAQPSAVRVSPQAEGAVLVLGLLGLAGGLLWSHAQSAHAPAPRSG